MSGIKKLEWEQINNNLLRAVTPFGTYIINYQEDLGGWYLEHQLYNVNYAWPMSLERCKEAAQADFTGRVEGCLKKED